MIALAPVVGVVVELALFAAGSSWVGVVEGWTAPICHHDPARTLELGGKLMPVCARCTGMYGAAAIGGVLGLAVGGRRQWVRTALAVAGVGLGLGLAVAAAESAGVLATSNPVRVGLGALLGAGPTLVAGSAARLLLGEARADPR